MKAHVMERRRGMDDERPASDGVSIGKSAWITQKGVRAANRSTMKNPVAHCGLEFPDRVTPKTQWFGHSASPTGLRHFGASSRGTRFSWRERRYNDRLSPRDFKLSADHICSNFPSP